MSATPKDTSIMATTNPETKTAEAEAADKRFKPKNNALTGRKHLEQALNAGPSAIREQIQYILALSQVLGAKSSVVPYPETPLTVRQARLKVLSEMVEHFSEEQIRTLARDVAQIDEATVRLPLLAQFACKLPLEDCRVALRDIWKQANTIVDPVARAETLFGLAPLLAQMEAEPLASTPLFRVAQLAERIRNFDGRIRSLIALSPYLPEEMRIAQFEDVLNELEKSHNDALCSRSLAALAPHWPAEFFDYILHVTATIRNPVERAHALTHIARHATAQYQEQLQEIALEAIDAIEEEDKRAEALIAFAPNLEIAEPDSEYPAVLQRALTITIMISRRHLRVRVLVALAPHLTADLQGEALAAVHSLETERERALLLAQLAPTLPADMLVASLAVAHTLRERDSRVHALTVLAQYAPEHARRQTMMDAIATASSLSNLFERVQALVNLVDILPVDLQVQALTNALTAAGGIKNENAQARAISLLGNCLPPALIIKALELARTIQNLEQRLHALQGLVNRLPEEHKERVTDEMLQQGQMLTPTYKRVRVLIAIIPHLSQKQFATLPTIIELLEESVDQVTVYIAALQHLPPAQRQPLLKKAWSRLLRIDDGYDRASALAALLPFTDAAIKQQLPEYIYATIHNISDEYDKASAIALLVAELGNRNDAAPIMLPDHYTALRKGIEAALMVPQQRLRTILLQRGAALWIGGEHVGRTYDLWRNMTKRLITLPLADVLLCLGALMPIIQEFAGEDRTKDIAEILGMR